MSWLNPHINRLFDFLFLPFLAMDPLWGLVWISALTTILVLVIYRFFSNQPAIAEVKDRIKVALLELRLFQHDHVQMTKSIGSILRANFRYLLLNMRPFLFMVFPVGLALIQMDIRVAHRPLLPGERTLVKVLFSQEWYPLIREDIQIAATEGIRIETPPLHIPSNREVSWRIRAVSQGRHTIQITSPDAVHTQQILVSPHLIPVDSKTVKPGVLNELFHPGNHPLSSASLSSIEVAYPPRTICLFSNFSMHWMLLFFLLTICMGFALKGLFGIQI